MKYEIKIQQIYTSKLAGENEITVVAFTIIGTEGDDSASLYAEVNLKKPNPDKIIKIENLTQDIVKSWVDEAIAEKLSEYETILKKRIEDHKNPIIPVESPWNKVEEIKVQIPDFLRPKFDNL
jgi:hypothetical protein